MELPKFTNRKPTSYYNPPDGMPCHCTVDPIEDDAAEVAAALNHPDVRAGKAYIGLNCEYYVGTLWFDGKVWQERTWRHYSPDEDSFRSVFELWREIMHGPAPDVLAPDVQQESSDGH